MSQKSMLYACFSSEMLSLSALRNAFISFSSFNVIPVCKCKWSHDNRVILQCSLPYTELLSLIYLINQSQHNDNQAPSTRHLSCLFKSSNHSVVPSKQKAGVSKCSYSENTRYTYPHCVYSYGANFILCNYAIDMSMW